MLGGHSVKEECSAASPSVSGPTSAPETRKKKFGRLVVSSPATQCACVRKEICICGSRIRTESKTKLRQHGFINWWFRSCKRSLKKSHSKPPKIRAMLIETYEPARKRNSVERSQKGRCCLGIPHRSASCVSVVLTICCQGRSP